MASRRLPHSKVTARYPSLRSWLCLFALLPYFLLPAVFYSHLTVELPPAAGAEVKGASTFIAGQPPTFHPEDNRNCPICRAASSFEDYGCLDLAQAPHDAAHFLGLSLTNPAPLISPCGLGMAASRAPPLYL